MVIDLGFMMKVYTAWNLGSGFSRLASWVIACLRISNTVVFPQLVKPTNITPNLTWNVSNSWKILRICTGT